MRGRARGTHVLGSRRDGGVTLLDLRGQVPLFRDVPQQGLRRPDTETGEFPVRQVSEGLQGLGQRMRGNPKRRRLACS